MADGKVIIQAGLDSKEFQNGLKELSAKTKTGMSGFTKGAIGGGVALALLKKTMGSLMSDMDKTNAAWKTFGDNMKAAGHSTGEIQKAKKDMQDFSAKSIYYSSEMAATYAQLDAVGIKSTGNIVKGFGAVAAASQNPRQAMKTVSQQATQMAAKPKVAWMDFKLMLEQTPAGISQVAKVMGKSTKQLVSEVQKGKIKTQDFFNAIAKIGGNPKHQLMKMATTYKTVGEAADGVKGTLMTRLAPAYKVVSKAAISALTEMMGKIGKIDGAALAEKVESGMKKAKPVVKDFISVVKVLAATVKAAGTPLLGAGLGILKIAAASPKATAAVAGMIGAFKSFGKIKNGIGIAKTTLDGYKVLAEKILNVSTAQRNLASIRGVGKDAIVAENLMAAGYEKTGKAIGAVQSGLNSLSSKLKLANPLTLSAIAPVAALTAGLVACGAAIYKNVQSHSRWTAEVEKAKQTAENRVKSAESEIETINFYKTQLDSLASKENKTSEDKQRMLFLTEQLNKEVPGLNLKYNAQTDSLNKTAKAIDAKIEARKREIKAEVYAKNLKDSYAEEAKLEKNKQDLLDKQAKAKKAEAEALKNGGDTLQNAKLAEARKKLTGLKKDIDNVTQAQKNNKKNTQYWEGKLSGLSGNIKKTMSSAMKSAKNAGIKLPKAVADGIKAGKINVSNAQAEINNAVKFDSLIAKAKKKGIKIPQSLKSGISSGKMLPSEGVAKMNKLISNSTGKASKPAKGHGRNVSKGVASGISGNSKSAVNAARAMISRVKAQGHGTYDSGSSSGSNFAQGFINGIAGLVGDVVSAARNFVGKAISSARKRQDERSPSRVMKKSGKHYGQGYIIGINKQRKHVAKAARRLAGAAIKGVKHKRAKAKGASFAQGIAKGIVSSYKAVKKAGNTLMKKALKKAKAPKGNYAGIGNSFTSDLSKALTKQKQKSNKAFSNYTKRIIKGAKSGKAKKNMRKAASILKKSFSDALTAGNKAINKKAQKQIKALTDDYQNQYNTLVEKRKSMRENLVSAGNLFEKTEGSLSGLREFNSSSLNSALKQNLKSLSKYRSNLNALKGRVPDDLMQEILGLGVGDANKYMRKLIKLNDERFKEYIDKWRSQQNQVKDIESRYHKSVNLTDMGSQVAGLKKYEKSLAALKKKGASSSLMEEITSMGVEDANVYMDKLLSLTDSKLKEYIKLWNQKQSLAKSISNKYYSDRFKALEKSFKKAITSAMASVQAELKRFGTNLIKNFVARASKKSNPKKVKSTAKKVKRDKKLKKAVSPKKPKKKSKKKKTKKKSKKKVTARKKTFTKKGKKKAVKKTYKKKAVRKTSKKKKRINKKAFETRVKSAVNNPKTYAKVKAAVIGEISKAPSNAVVKQSRVAAQNESQSAGLLEVHVHTEIDGREVARATSRFTNEELANAQKLKERGV